MMIDTNDITHFNGLTWEQWRDQFEGYYEHLRSTVEGFDGCGPGPVMTQTGEECWREYWLGGYTPVEALEEYRTYWE